MKFFAGHHPLIMRRHQTTFRSKRPQERPISRRYCFSLSSAKKIAHRSRLNTNQAEQKTFCYFYKCMKDLETTRQSFFTTTFFHKKCTMRLEVLFLHFLYVYLHVCTIFRHIFCLFQIQLQDMRPIFRQSTNSMNMRPKFMMLMIKNLW